MADNELHSSADESSSDDEDYCPEADSRRNAELSEEDESGNESNGDGDDDADAGAAKRKHSSNKKTTGASSRKRKAVASGNNAKDDGAVADEVTASTTDTTEEQREKARADALWADFLTDADPPSRPTPSPVATATTKTTKTSQTIQTATAATTTTSQPAAKKQIVTETVEYAGEKIEITKEVPVVAAKAAASNGTSPATRKLTPGPAPRRTAAGGGGGLAAILSQMNKTKKIGTLEKTKLDWNSFKRKEGIEEQLQTHNRGKDGYLERQDFLQRTDLRQFEIEKDLRTSSSSSRRGK